MLSKNKQRFIISLQRKKAREENRMFVIEGDKMVREFLSSEMEIISLLAKPEYISGLGSSLSGKANEVIPVSFEELRKISTMKTPHNALAVVKMPETGFDEDEVLNGFCAALDFIQDPGNLGTIIRAAAWFGIKNVVCSSNCVDVFNPKALQATMGALLNVKVYYRNLEDFLEMALKRKLDVFGTYLDGHPVYAHPLAGKGVILLGNESRGISDSLAPFVTVRLVIPKFTTASPGIESLNAGMAASVIFYEFRRRYQA